MKVYNGREERERNWKEKIPLNKVFGLRPEGVCAYFLQSFSLNTCMKTCLVGIEWKMGPRGGGLTSFMKTFVSLNFGNSKSAANVFGCFHNYFEYKLWNSFV